MLTSKFDVDVHQTHAAEDTLEALRSANYSLVLINRKLDIDYSDGTRILLSIKSDVDLKSVPVMIVTNYAEHQETAVGQGAERGFGKLELNSSATLSKLSQFLA
jgi:CheY-like chemotaxis protein